MKIYELVALKQPNKQHGVTMSKQQSVIATQIFAKLSWRETQVTIERRDGRTQLQVAVVSRAFHLSPHDFSRFFIAFYTLTHANVESRTALQKKKKDGNESKQTAVIATD